jgi:hypothetical protein
VIILVVALIWLVLLFLTFRPPAPKPATLGFFLLLLLATGILAYVFLVQVFNFNPNPTRVKIANRLVENKFIDLTQVVPGVYDLNDIHRIDTDYAQETIPEEWVAFYQYDVHRPAEGRPQGPFGAAIYDSSDCRPPAILSYELVPVSYDYLGEDAATIAVDNIIAYNDPLSGLQDRPEVLILGVTERSITDLNIFRKVGVELSCLDWQQWRAAHPADEFPNPVRYPNIGSFRATDRVERNGSTVTVVDRAGFERSQFVVKRQYRPLDGSYFRPGTQVLLDPVEYGLYFVQNPPDEVSRVYYPEKAVLAFYLALGKDETNLTRAESYLSDAAMSRYSVQMDQFGLAIPRADLARVLVWEIRYLPDAAAEQAHQDRTVQVTVVGVKADGTIDRDNPRLVTWKIVGVSKAGAIPYGCEWKLDQIVSVTTP